MVIGDLTHCPCFGHFQAVGSRPSACAHNAALVLKFDQLLRLQMNPFEGALILHLHLHFHLPGRFGKQTSQADRIMLVDANAIFADRGRLQVAG